jgi:phosphate transport system protein
MPHIVKSFDGELSALRETILTMARLADSQLEKAMQALATQDPEEARAVIAGDAEVDRLEALVNDQVVRVLARPTGPWRSGIPTATSMRCMPACSASC